MRGYILMNQPDTKKKIRKPKVNLNEVHGWANGQHVVIVALKLFMLDDLPASFFVEEGKLFDNAETRLKRIIWGRLCEWQEPVLRQQRCQFCFDNDLK